MSSAAFYRLAFGAVPKLVRIGAAAAASSCIPNQPCRTNHAAKTVPVSQRRALAFAGACVPDHCSLAAYLAASTVPNLISFAGIASSLECTGSVGTTGEAGSIVEKAVLLAGEAFVSGNY